MQTLITQVFEYGEARFLSTRGKKPLGHNVYIEGELWGFIPYNEKHRPKFKPANTYCGLNAVGWSIRAKYWEYKFNSLTKDENKKESKPS